MHGSWQPVHEWSTSADGTQTGWGQTLALVSGGAIGQLLIQGLLPQKATKKLACQVWQIISELWLMWQVHALADSWYDDALSSDICWTQSSTFRWMGRWCHCCHDLSLRGPSGDAARLTWSVLNQYLLLCFSRCLLSAQTCTWTVQVENALVHCVRCQSSYFIAMFLSCIICSGAACFIYTETSATSSTCFSVQFCTVCGVPDFTLCCFDCSFAVHIAVHIHGFTSIACTRDDNHSVILLCYTAVIPVVLLTRRCIAAS